MHTDLKYHHLGIPAKEKREGETYLKEFKVYVPVTIQARIGLNGCVMNTIHSLRNW